jgi:hypothetical protein
MDYTEDGLIRVRGLRDILTKGDSYPSYRPLKIYEPRPSTPENVPFHDKIKACLKEYSDTYKPPQREAFGNPWRPSPDASGSRFIPKSPEQAFGIPFRREERYETSPHYISTPRDISPRRNMFPPHEITPSRFNLLAYYEERQSYRVIQPRGRLFEDRLQMSERDKFVEKRQRNTESARRYFMYG